jgi:hypothetical protein
VSVARCENCGRTLCITCAIPVRNTVYGTECLAAVLGDDVAAQAGNTARRAPSARLMTVTCAFAVAVIGTLLPWTRFQEGSGPFGAWGLSPRWSLVAAVAAVVGLAASLRAWRETTAALATALRLSAVALVAGCVLAIGRPPAFAPAWLGPWVTLVGGAVATALAYGFVHPVARERRPERGHARAG